MTKFSPEDVLHRKLKALPKDALTELCSLQNLDSKGKISELIGSLFGKKIPEQYIDDFIKKKYQVKKQKDWFDMGISISAIKDEVDKVDSHIWGVVQGELDAHIQKNYVRKYFKYDEIVQAVDSQLSREVKSYTLCTWYNHWTTVVIEDILASHKKVVPTVKDVKGVDFFWCGQPWDLKNTNLPREWFQAGRTIDDAINDPVSAAKQLYELQGSQRFGDENRFFIIIQDRKNPHQTWKLKRDFGLIQEKIQAFFDTNDSFEEVNFVFNNQAYLAHSKILFIVK